MSQLCNLLSFVSQFIKKYSMFLVFSAPRSLQYWSHPVCVYVCCAALSPSFYFCLHSSSFVCSTSPPFRLRQVSSIRPSTLVCLFRMFVRLPEPLLSVSASLAASLWKKLRKREQPGKYKQTQQQRLHSESSLIRLQIPHQTKQFLVE